MERKIIQIINKDFSLWFFKYNVNKSEEKNKKEKERNGLFWRNMFYK